MIEYSKLRKRGAPVTKKKNTASATENGKTSSGQAAAEHATEEKKRVAKAQVSASAKSGSEIEEAECDIPLGEFASRMELEVLYAGKNDIIHFSTFNVSRPGLQLAGYYKHFSAERVQVIGEMEMTYLQQMTHQARRTACETLLKQQIPCIIITSTIEPSSELLFAAQKFDTLQ